MTWPSSSQIDRIPEPKPPVPEAHIQLAGSWSPTVGTLAVTRRLAASRLKMAGQRKENMMATMTKRDFENLAKDLRWFRLASEPQADLIDRLKKVRKHLTDVDGWSMKDVGAITDAIALVNRVNKGFDQLLADMTETCKTGNRSFDAERFEEAVRRDRRSY